MILKEWEEVVTQEGTKLLQFFEPTKCFNDFFTDSFHIVIRKMSIVLDFAYGLVPYNGNLILANYTITAKQGQNICSLVVIG